MNNWTVILGAAALLFLPYPEAPAGGGVGQRQCSDTPLLKLAPTGAHPALNPLPGNSKFAAARTRRPEQNGLATASSTAAAPSLPPTGEASWAGISTNAEWRQRSSFPRGPPIS
jgi:hypothetical protein